MITESMARSMSDKNLVSNLIQEVGRTKPQNPYFSARHESDKLHDAQESVRNLSQELEKRLKEGRQAIQKLKKLETKSKKKTK